MNVNTKGGAGDVAAAWNVPNWAGGAATGDRAIVATIVFDLPRVASPKKRSATPPARPDLGHEHVGDAAAEAELELRGVGRRGQRQVLLRRARSYFVEPARRAALEAALDRAQRVEGDVRALEAAPPL